jgi:hypothetical protein
MADTPGPGAAEADDDNSDLIYKAAAVAGLVISALTIWRWIKTGDL